LSWSQQRLWFLDHFEGAGAAYHLADALRLTGALDETALIAALNTIVERHEVLRTVFAMVEGKPVQVIQSDASFALEVINLSIQSTTEREAEVARQVAEEADT